MIDDILILIENVYRLDGATHHDVNIFGVLQMEQQVRRRSMKWPANHGAGPGIPRLPAPGHHYH